MAEFRIEAAAQTAKSAPALAGVFYYGLTLNEMVAIVTIFYIALQCAYLVWKWVREAKRGR